MDAYVSSQRSKTMTTHQATQDGLAARQRPSAGAYNEGDDGEAGGDDIDDGLWDADIDDPAAANPRKKQKHRDAAASAETIVKKKKKKKMEEDHAATEDALNKKKKKIKKKRDREVDTNIPAAAELHASLEGNTEPVTHKRHKQSSESIHTATAALRDATH